MTASARIPNWLTRPTWWSAALLFSLGSLLAAESLQIWWSSPTLASEFMSRPTWVAWAAWFSGKPVALDQTEANIPYGSVLIFAAAVQSAALLLGSAVLALCGQAWRPSLIRWGHFGGCWWCLLGLWDWISIGLKLIGADPLVEFWGLIPAFWSALCLAGGMTTWLALASAKRQVNGDDARRSAIPLWSFIAIYCAVFVTLNWRLYFNLLIPHGDSAMYEEHLWNILHGKGFRSYLDQGLFLGEHIQVVHLGLLPLYYFWPSHLLLELCESLALALGAWPVYWMTRRHAGSHAAGLAAAAAYLLYPPMQFLDIEIDLKTFRPEAFGIPIFLLTFDQLDRRNLRGTLLGILGCLTVKEDYAIVLAPLGIWIAVSAWVNRKQSPSPEPEPGAIAGRHWIVFGLALTVGSAAYLYLATRVVMPWFRSGAEIHYTNYFQTFGKTPEEILRTMLTRPDLLLREIVRTSTVLYALMLLLPAAGLPLLSPGRLAVGLPLFGILCLNEVARDPRHQFHAPLVAIVFWALAGGWNQALALCARLSSSGPLAPAAGERVRERGGALPDAGHLEIPSLVPHAVWTSSLAMAVFFSLSPVSLTFWDAGSEWHWRKLYGPNRRADDFAQIAELIPRSARVASTDFVHPRYTHHEQSYDYSQYRRKISDYEDKVPDDTDYIVIDTQHRYSEMKTPTDVPEYRNHPNAWELLRDGPFIVLKRKKIP